MKTELIFLLFVVAVVAVGAGFALAIFLKKRTEGQHAAAGENAVKILEDARRESETIIREAAIQAKDVVYQAKAEFEKESVDKRRDLQALEKRVQQKEENLDKKVNLFDQREIEFSKKSRHLLPKSS